MASSSDRSTMVVETTVTLASAPSAVWPLITDTDRMNRLLFGRPVVYRPIEGGGSAARFVVDAKAAGFSMSYEEAPFEWSVNKSFSVHRRMRSGPLEAYTWRTALAPSDGGGTRATIRLELTPRHWLLRPVVAMSARRIVAGIARLAGEIDAHLRDRAPSPFEKPSTPADPDKLAAARRALVDRGLDAAAVDLVLAQVREAPDADLVRVRPFELAAAHGVDGRDTLRVLLHAVTLGVFELRWAIVCPSCRTAADHVESLAEVGDSGHCQMCDLTYGVDLDRAVEATFRPHPSVRSVPDKMFCMGGPWRTPHVLVQANVDAGASRALDAPPEPGRYRVFARGGAVASVEIDDGAPREIELSLSDEGLAPVELAIAPGGALRVVNATAEPRHVKIERLGYASLAATAHVVTMMSEFRRLFSKELLKPSTPLHVRCSAILFSDLTGSTALYTKAGDAAAFRLVDDHFDVLRTAIDEAGGAVVKTMGDAVMAAFLEPAAAVRAAAACLRAFETFRRTHEHGELTGLKVGVYAGPCYVVTANATIDYFGQTVNCASRVQHLAGSGELVVEEGTFEALPEADRAGLRVLEVFSARVKGVDEPLRLVRVGLAQAAAGRADRPEAEAGDVAATA